MMIIRYKLPNFKENQFFVFEGNSVADIDEVKTITTEWLNESYDIQNIYFETKKFIFRVKETEFLALQKLKYAYEIYINENNEWIKYKFKDIEINEIFAGFKEITIYFKGVKKIVSNKILESEIVNKLTIREQEITLAVFNLYLLPIKNQKLNKNIVDAFHNQIVDYSQQKIYYNIRMFLNSDNYFLLMNYLLNKKTYNFLKLNDNILNFTDFEITSQENLGENLYQVDLKLISETNIQTYY